MLKMAYSTIKEPISMQFYYNILHSLTNLLWKIETLQRLSLWIWKNIKDRLPTIEQLFKRCIINDKKCIICGSDTDSFQHSIFE